MYNVTLYSFIILFHYVLPFRNLDYYTDPADPFFISTTPLIAYNTPYTVTIGVKVNHQFDMSTITKIVYLKEMDGVTKTLSLGTSITIGSTFTYQPAKNTIKFKFSMQNQPDRHILREIKNSTGNYLNSQIIFAKNSHTELYGKPLSLVFANPNDEAYYEFTYTNNATFDIILDYINEISHTEVIQTHATRNATYDMSLLPLPKVVKLYLGVNKVYHLNGELELIRYDFTTKCQRITGDDIVIDITSVTTDLSTYTLIIGGERISKNTQETTHLNFIYPKSKFIPGVYAIRFGKETATGMGVTVNEQYLYLIEDFTVRTILPDITSVPYITVEFNYDVDPIPDLSFSLSKETTVISIAVSDCEYKENLVKNVIICTVPNFKSIDEGEYIFSYTIPSCSDKGIGTTATYTKTIQINRATIQTAIFDVIFPSYTLNGYNNPVTIRTVYLYDLDKITNINFIRTDYLGNTFNVLYTKDSGENIFTYDSTNDEITLNLFYLKGDLLELHEMTDDESTVIFNNKFLFGYTNPLVFICSPIIDVNVDVECEIKIAKWGEGDFDINTIDTITLEYPDLSTVSYCDSSPCEILNKVNETYAKIYIKAVDSNQFYSFISITSSDGKLSVSYDKSKENYPKYYKESLTKVETNEFKFITKTTTNYISNFQYPIDAFLFINDFPFTECSPFSSDASKRSCTLSSNALPSKNNVKILYHNIYYTQNSFDVVIYEASKTCQNKIDSDLLYITLTSFDDNTLLDTSMYLNEDMNNKAEGVASSTSDKIFTYTFDNNKLTNGEYDRFNLIKGSTDSNSTIENIFVFISNDINAIAGSLNGGQSAQILTFSFDEDITNIKGVKLTDVDIDEDEREIEPDSDCSVDIANKEIECSFDMTNYYGYEYSVSFISDCNDREFTTNKVVSAILPQIAIYIENDNILINSNVKLTFHPKLKGTITGVELIDVNDVTNVIGVSFTNATKKNVNFNSGINLGIYVIKVTTAQESVQYSNVLIYQNQIELAQNKIVLPSENVQIDKIIIPLMKSITKAQIEYIIEDTNTLLFTYDISGNNIELLFTSGGFTFSTPNEYLIKIKDRLQSNEIEFTIKVVQPPLFSFPQTLFIVDSPLKTLSISVSNLGTSPDTITIENIYQYEPPSTYTPLSTGYKLTVDTSIEREISFVYKVAYYYYPISTKVNVVNKDYAMLFNTIVPCTYLSQNSFTIDLNLIDATTAIDNDLIELKVRKTTGEDVQYDKIGNIYTNSNVSPGKYLFDLVYSGDTLPFYSSSFTLTSFDKTKNSFNIVNSVFKIDLTNMLCDAGINSLTLQQGALINIPLVCSYALNTLTCSLQNESDISNLSDGEYDLIRGISETFLHIILRFLTECLGENNKLDTNTGKCLSTCKNNGNYDKDYENECIEQCPPGTGLIFGFCIEGITIISENSTEIVVEGDRVNLDKVITDNIDIFSSFGKTISSEDYIIESYSTDSPISDPEYKATKINFTLCEEKIKNEYNLTESLLIYKVDTVNTSAITNNVGYRIFTQNGIELDISKCDGVHIDISYPVNTNLINLTYGEEFFIKEGIDIYNAEDDFFNDICYPYATEEDTDMIIKDRRKDIFQNISFCEENCKYKGIDYTTNMANCECEVDTDDKSEIIGANEFTSDIFSNNIAITKCFHLFITKTRQNNIGFWYSLIAMITVISCGFIFSFRDYITLLSMVNQHMKESPPKNEIFDLYDNNNEIVGKKYNYSQIATGATESNKLMTEEREEIQKKIIVNLPGVPKDPDNFPYKRAIVKDKRSFIFVFWKLFTEKDEMFHIFSDSNEFEFFSIKLSNFILNLSVTFVLNGIFYTDSQLSSRYENGELSFWQDMLRSIPASIISLIIGIIFSSLTSFPNILEMLIVEVKTSQFAKFMYNLKKSITMKLTLYYILGTVILLLFLYYLSLFCIVYHSSQVSWITGCLYSLALGVLTNLAIMLALTILRYVALRSKNEYMYNVQLYIKNII